MVALGLAVVLLVSRRHRGVRDAVRPAHRGRASASACVAEAAFLTYVVVLGRRACAAGATGDLDRRRGGRRAAGGLRPAGRGMGAPPAALTLLADLPLSVLDLAPIRHGETVGESFAASVALAQLAEDAGYQRVWYAEHHNMPTIASSATSVLIAHVAARHRADPARRRRRHAAQPLAARDRRAVRHPGRAAIPAASISGSAARRASTSNTMYALRRDPAVADAFPQDVSSCRATSPGSRWCPASHAYPGSGTSVPLYILGSSLFGAQLAAALGLPYAFASHFAPAALHDAVDDLPARVPAVGRSSTGPYVIAGVNAFAADTQDDADEQFQQTKRQRVRLFARPGRPLHRRGLDAVLASPEGAQIAQMVQYSAVGRPPRFATIWRTSPRPRTPTS